MEANANLLAEMARYKVTEQSIADVIGKSRKTTHTKIKGDVQFTWAEVCKIRKTFFSDLSLEYLFGDE